MTGAPGVVVDSGFLKTTVTPVLHGYPVPHLFKTLNVGGHHVTQRLSRLLEQMGNGYKLNATPNFIIESDGTGNNINNYDDSKSSYDNSGDYNYNDYNYNKK